MKKTLLSLLVGCVVCATTSFAQINLTPRAKQMTQSSGTWTLPAGMRVCYGQLPDSLVTEAARFVSDLNAATGLGAVASQRQQGEVVMQFDADCQPEGYRLDVTADGVLVKASTASGFYYAFQTLRKILPANVMARQYDASQTYQWPLVSIDDEPRFHYRGFMLDVSRHFFPVEEIKRMLDIMAAYKMNVFH